MSLTSAEGDDGALEDAIDLPEGTGNGVASPNGTKEETVAEEASNEENEADAACHSINGDDQRTTGEDGQDNITPKQAGVKNPSEEVADIESVDETTSVPDDTPSLPGSILSSPRSESVSLRTPGSRASSTGVHRPFDRRFQSRLSLSPSNSPHAISPAFLKSHSRQSSLSSITPQVLDSDPTSAPWDVIRWTKLRKLSGQAFSEGGKINFGRPTCMAVTTQIVLGTSKGVILVFDYQQNHAGIIGMGTKAVECGAVTSLAISADHTTVAAGHAGGHIFTWELARSSKPFLDIPPIDSGHAQARKGDGHVSGVAILHIGFLGYRHTALVSADDKGMAFSHLATRGMGAVSRTVRTTRVLGRYPDIILRGTTTRRQSSVLAFSPLPFGNIEQSTDKLGLVAMMTPYLLVIVSTTPIAQTQHKSARPKEIAAHSTMSAALAWFPAIKLKGGESTVSNTKLVYCWSNVLTVLDVITEEPSGSVDNEKPPVLLFRPRSRRKFEEAIVAVQWLNRSVLAVVTVTQQLIILEDHSMRVADSLDLVQKYIYHTDLYSRQLHSLVEQLDEEDTTMHGVVADGFYMSFRAYKGRLFLLGFNDIAIGSLSNWADRLLALMEAGNLIAAIRLATSYYSGEAEKVAIGLPEDDEARHDMVQEKLLEMMTASLKYAFGRNVEVGPVRLEESQLQDLAEACLTACLAIGDQEFLFHEVFSWFEDHQQSRLFLEILESRIVDGQVTSLPPTVVKTLIEYFWTTHTASSLEEIICLLDPSTMDIDQVTGLCKKYNLYDAYIYVWNKALNDYISPLEELLKMANGQHGASGNVNTIAEDLANAQKIFPFLSFIWTGRTYPTGIEMDDLQANIAKGQIYNFLFAPSSGPALNGHKKSSQPYAQLRQLLAFDTSSFMSVLNEAFEDGFLSETKDEHVNGVTDTAQSKTMNRQYIVRIMLEVLNPQSFASENTIYLDMFIARNLPKYPQYILLSGSTLHQVLVRLCDVPSKDMRDDCELSMEYLLSVYHPPDIATLIPLFQRANFFRVLKSIFRSEQRFAEWVDTFFRTREDEEDVFGAIGECLQSESKLTERQRREVMDVIRNHTHDLVMIDERKSAATIDEVAPELHEYFLDSLQPRGRYDYLNEIIEPNGVRVGGKKSALIENYVRLMCEYDPGHVASYVESLNPDDLELDQVLPSIETRGIIDAAVVLLARAGQAKNAMQRLVDHFSTLQSTLVSISSRDSTDMKDSSMGDALSKVQESIDKYAKAGVWLCQNQTKTTQRSRAATKPPKRSTMQPLTLDESLWLDLIISIVSIAQAVLPLGSMPQAVVLQLRTTIQFVFTSLLTITSSQSTSSSPSPTGDYSFLRILLAFLTHASAQSPSLSALRTVLSSIFAAYAYEESLLALANGILDKDLFVHVDEIAKLRQRGWRPKGQSCEVCRRRVWGPGTGALVWDAWTKRQREGEIKRLQRSIDESQNPGDSRDRGKGKATAEATNVSSDDAEKLDLGPIVVFKCRHVYHQRCLTGVGAGDGREGLRPPSQHTEHLELACPACS